MVSLVPEGQSDRRGWGGGTLRYLVTSVLLDSSFQIVEALVPSSEDGLGVDYTLSVYPDHCRIRSSAGASS